MMTFDRVLPELIRACEEEADSRDTVARYCIVRDVRGRVRLVIDPQKAPAPALESLQAALSATLGDYFVAPILSAASGGDVQRLARQLIEQAQGKWPTGWPRAYRNLLGGRETPIDAGTRWTGIERTIGKEAWLTSTPPMPPWPLVKGKTPAIVTFHSFKGGVGRTTLVAAYAIRVASGKPPRRVAVIDLDLEAPGVSSLLGASPERGVLDVLVDHIATGRIDLAGASAPAQLESGLGAQITVFSAGRPGDAYLQKLARLDFSSTEPGQENPVGLALGEMLKSMKAEFDVILLDSRAGLHDLAGMSLHGLAHTDVLVFRGTEQNLSGLGQTLRSIGSRESTQLLLVETMLPANDEGLFEVRRTRTRDRVYELLCDYVYPEEDPPQLGDAGEPHDVVAVRRREWLDGLDSLNGHVEQVLNDDGLSEVARRIDEECGLDYERAADAESGEDQE
jgi:MinD-like ATPase involved in chromosome partitioning or flagellar assembly